MNFRPNYCNSCGEQIERIEWKPWTSRKYCETCEPEFRKEEWLPRIVILLGAFSTIFSLGGYLKQSEQNLNNNLTINSASQIKETSNQKVVQVSEKSNNLPIEAKTFVEKPIEPQVKTYKQPEQIVVEKSSTEQLKVPQTEAKEIVYYCGAKTKKGTLCSRKVKSPERCWQHAGELATLPQEKLKAVER